MSWYRTISPGERLRLEFATLVAQELYESTAILAQNLGRFRDSQALREIGQILEQAGFIEYGADGNLYLNTPQWPTTYLKDVKCPALVVSADLPNRPPTISEIRHAENQANLAIENDDLASHISGLLRPPIINDGIEAVEEIQQGDSVPHRAYAMFMSPNSYLTFIAETDFEPTTRFPLLREGVQGLYQGLVVCLSRKCEVGQIAITSDNGRTAVINSN